MFGDRQKMARFGLSSTLTLAEYQAMKPDLAAGRSYLALANPTNAQSVAVIKPIIRVLAALLRDS